VSANKWRIYDKGVGMVAMHAPTEDGIRYAWDVLPDNIRDGMVLLEPGEPEPAPTTATEER
jgi:hypothetical protein